MDRFDEMRAKIGAQSSNGETSEPEIMGAEVTIEAMQNLKTGDKFKGIANASAETTIVSASYDNSNMAIISEDLSVGLVNQNIANGTESVQIGFLNDYNSYDLYDVPLDSSSITEAFSTSSLSSINEDGSLIMIGGILNSNGFYNGILVIEVNKSKRTAVAKYYDEPCSFGSFTTSEYSTTGHIANSSGRTTYIKGFILTKNYLIYTFRMSYLDSAGTEKFNYSTAIYYYDSSFKSLPVVKHPIFETYSNINARTTSQTAIAWYDNNTLIVIYSNNGKYYTANVSSVAYKYVLNNGELVSHTSATITSILSYNSGSTRKWHTDTFALSKNARYLGRQAYTANDNREAYIYKFNPVDMTYEQLAKLSGGTYLATYVPYVDKNGEYFLYNTNIRRISDPTTDLYTGGTISSRYFDVEGEDSYRSGTKVYKLAPKDGTAEYLAYLCVDGNVIEQDCVYGVVSEDIMAGELGKGKKLFDTYSYPDPSLQAKTITLTEESQTVTADAGYDGLSSVTAKLSLQSKSATPQAEEQVISVDSGYSGMKQVTIAGDSNLIAENIKAGVKIFGVTGTLSSASSGGTEEPTETFEQIVNYTMLYDYGDECTALTGGYENNTGSNSYTKPTTLTKNENNIYMARSSSSGGNVHYQSTNPVDFTGYSGVFAVFEAYKSKSNTATGSFAGVTFAYGSNTNGVGYGTGVASVGEQDTSDGAYTYEKGMRIKTGVSYSGSVYVCPMLTNPAADFTHNLYATGFLKDDDWQTLALKAGILADSMDSLINQASTLLANANAVEFMIKQCTGTFMAKAVTSSTFKSALASSLHYSTVISNSHWYKFLSMAT